MKTGKYRYANASENKSVRKELLVCLSIAQIVLLSGMILHKIRRIFQKINLSSTFLKISGRVGIRNRLILIVLLFASVISVSFAQTQPSIDDYRSNATIMNWSTTTSWERWNGASWEIATTWPGQIAGTGKVTIRDRHIVTINVSPANPISSLLVGEGSSGILQYEAIYSQILTVSKIVTINSKGIFRSALTGSISNHQLIVEGSIMNNGTIDFNANLYGSGVLIKFTGTSLSETFNCQDAVRTNLMSINGLVLDKGNSAASVLTFNPGASGRFKVQSLNNNGFLTIKNGTFKIIGDNSFSNPVFCKASPTIPVTGGFELSNAKATVVGQYGTITNNGLVRITAGTFNVGTKSGNSINTSSTGTFVQSGGTINIAGRFTINDGECTISGGTMNLATIGHADKSQGAFHISPFADLVMSGNPLITFSHPNSHPTIPFNDIEIVMGTGAKTITGGTFQMGTTSTLPNDTFLVNSDIPIYNLRIFNIKSFVSLTDNLTVNNQLVMNGGNLVASNYTVTITNPAINAISRNYGFVIGTLERAIASSGSSTYTFPVGNGTNYTPVELTFTNLSNGGLIGVNSLGSENPNLTSSVLNPTKSVNNYWGISNTGVSFLNLNGMITFPSKLLDPGVNTSNLHFGLFNNLSWSYPSTSFTGSNFNFTGLASLVNSTIALAECMVPTITVGTNPDLKAAPSVCVGSTIALSPAGGGTWTSSNISIATVIAGLVTGISAGNVTFTFTQSGTLCSSTTPIVTVNPLPNPSLIYHN